MTPVDRLAELFGRVHAGDKSVRWIEMQKADLDLLEGSYVFQENYGYYIWGAAIKFEDSITRGYVKVDKLSGVHPFRVQ